MSDLCECGHNEETHGNDGCDPKFDDPCQCKEYNPTLTQAFDDQVGPKMFDEKKPIKVDTTWDIANMIESIHQNTADINDLSVAADSFNREAAHLCQRKKIVDKRLEALEQANTQTVSVSGSGDVLTEMQKDRDYWRSKCMKIQELIEGES